MVYVRQVIGKHANIVGVRVNYKADSFYVILVFEERLADAVHAVHDAAVAGENDGESKVGLQDEARMIRNLATGQFLALPA